MMCAIEEPQVCFFRMRKKENLVLAFSTLNLAHAHCLAKNLNFQICSRDLM